MSVFELVLLWSAAVIGVITVALGLVTMLLSGLISSRSRRRETRRDRLQPELFERLFSDDPAWNAWIETLSRAERRQLPTLLDEYLRQLRGTEHDRLRDLAAELGIPAGAKRDLSSDRNRYEALTWLALLAEPVDPVELKKHCGDEPQHRAGAARVLYRSDHADFAVAGTDLLIGGGEQSLTAFGMDTLYRLNNGTETPLLELLADGIGTWNQRLLVQSLLVLRYCNIADPGERLEWLSDAVTHESPRVRTAAVGVIERHGWRERLQDEIDVRALLSDPEAAVRHDTYLMLASWGSDRSAKWLREAFETEDDEDMLALARTLLLHTRLDFSELPSRFGPFVEWVRTDAAVGRKRRVWGVSAAWS